MPTEREIFSENLSFFFKLTMMIAYFTLETTLDATKEMGPTAPRESEDCFHSQQRLLRTTYPSPVKEVLILYFS